MMPLGTTCLYSIVEEYPPGGWRQNKNNLTAMAATILGNYFTNFYKRPPSWQVCFPNTGNQLYVFLKKRRPIHSDWCWAVILQMTFESFEWEICMLPGVRVHEALSSSIESRLGFLLWSMGSLSYDVRVNYSGYSCRRNDKFVWHNLDSIILASRLVWITHKLIYMCLSSIYNMPASTKLDCCKVSI